MKLNQILICLFASFLSVYTTIVLATNVGVSQFGANNYIEYIPGNLPIVLSAPHGGPLGDRGSDTVTNIEDRDCNNEEFAGNSCRTINDFNTAVLTQEIVNSFVAKTGC